MSFISTSSKRALLAATAILAWAAGNTAAAQRTPPMPRAPRAVTLDVPGPQVPDQAATDINFPPTPVGQTSTATCAAECFSSTTGGPGNCDGSGTISEDKALAAPFSVLNFRVTSGTGCSGTAVSLPVHLNSGQKLLFDFEFAPTSPGRFTDTLGLGGITWTLTGNTPVATSCTADGLTLCLNNNRFQVRATWSTRAGQSGNAQMVSLTDDTGYMWFFSSVNVEVVIKALNGCGVNNRFWVFAGGLTDVLVTIHVTDTMTSAMNTYINPQGTAFQPIQDTGAFFCP
jgi:hypothetical protein